jgi:hypothetical protein
MNHGICRTGAKDVSMLKKFNFTRNRRSLANSLFNSDFEHCVCPVGYVGLKCETKLDVCPGGQHACLHGGDCKTSMKDGIMEYVCDCTNAISRTSRFAGEYCEEESTQFCTIDGQMPLGGPASNAFCTNGGTCKGKVHISEL